MSLLEVTDLSACVDERLVIDHLNLSVHPGELHVVMGTNGAGKSSFFSVLAGHEAYQVQSGKLRYKNIDLTTLSAAERAVAGIFLSFQSPVELPGVRMLDFLQVSFNARQAYRREEPSDALAFKKMVKNIAGDLGYPLSFINRDLNVGFSGGEKKRTELFQASVLDPDLLLLDEPDSGVDSDLLKQTIFILRAMKERGKGIVAVTHYPHFAESLAPDYVHVFLKGKIVETGDLRLLKHITEKGYESFIA